MTTLIAVVVSVVGATPAWAMDPTCAAHGSYSTSHGYDVVIPAEGWGLTGWRVNPTVTAYDSCDHGALDVGVNVYNANALRKNGIVTTQVDFASTGINGWRSAAPLVDRTPAATGWVTFTYTAGVGSFGHVDLCSQCRITQVRFITTVWARQNGSNWTPLSSKTLTLNLLRPGWSST